MNKLSKAQHALLRYMPYTRGHTIHIGYNDTNRLSDLWSHCVSCNYTFFNDLTDIPKEDLKYFSKYVIGQWKKVNGSPSKRVTKGTQFNFGMDEFSLATFKNSIKKPFLRTEAKNIIIRVNKAYTSTSKSLQDISIRNRFYKLIFDNTDVHTKAMLNELLPTDLTPKDLGFYEPKADELIVIPISSWEYPDLQPYTNPSSRGDYSSDLNAVSDTTLELDLRGQQRTAVAAGIMTSLSIKTGNVVYEDLARRFLSQVKDKSEIVDQTLAARRLSEIASEMV